jgi:hypothetical protein
MAFVRANGPEQGKFLLLTANVDGTDEKVVGSGPGSFFPTLAAWSPDSNEAAVVVRGAGAAKLSIQLHNLASPKVETFARFDDLPLNDVAWLPRHRGLLATYQKDFGFITHSQIGVVSYPGGQFQSITQGYERLPDTYSFR